MQHSIVLENICINNCIRKYNTVHTPRKTAKASEKMHT